MSKNFKENSRDVGDLAEADFKVWCTLNRLIPSKPGKDRMGWDYFVEFEQEINKNISLDQQGDLKKAFVQVKSTDNMSKSVRGKLSAFKLLVDTDLPAFIIHITYSGQHSAQQARLLHIGPTQIEAILKKVRQTEKKGRFDLHNINMILSLEEAETIGERGAGLRDLILSVIPSSNADYVAAKAGLRRSCGYDDQSIKAHFTLAPNQPEEALVDLMIGKLPSLPIDEMVINKTRFGISLDKDIDRIEQGTLSVEVKPFQRGRAVAYRADGGLRSETRVNVYAPSIPSLPSHLRKIRIANDFLEIIIDFGRGTVDLEFSLAPNSRYPIDVLANAMGFGIALTQEEAKLEIHLDSGDVGTLEVPVDAQKFSHWRILHEFSELISTALFRHRRDTPYEATFSEISAIFEENRNMFALLKRPGLSMTFAPDQSIPDITTLKGNIYCPTCIEFGEFAYTATVKIEISNITLRKDGSIEVVGSNPQIVEDSIIDRKALNIAKLNERTASIGRAERAQERLTITANLSDPDIKNPTLYID